MKKLCLIVCALALFGFRGFAWGDHPKYIKHELGAPDKTFENNAGGDVYIYKGEVGSKSAYIQYHFLDNELVAGGYILDVDYMNNNKYIRDYEEFREMLTEKYGEPTKDFAEGDTDAENPGLQLGIGDLRLGSAWKDGDTIIQMNLKGTEGHVSLEIEYKDKNTDLSAKSKENTKEDL